MILETKVSQPIPTVHELSGHLHIFFSLRGVQCGRKSDAFKLWLMWSTLGLDYFRRVIEETEGCAQYFAETIRNRNGFLLYLDSHQCTNVFFWYVPPRLRERERSESWWTEIGQVTRSSIISQ